MVDGRRAAPSAAGHARFQALAPVRAAASGVSRASGTNESWLRVVMVVSDVQAIG